MKTSIHVNGFRQEKTQAFTLLELLVVVSIIFILAGMILGAGAYARNAAKVAKARTQLEHFHNILEEYRIRNGEYPLLLSALSIPPDLSLTDPWGSPYQYEHDPDTPHAFSIHSRGRLNGLEGRDNDSADDIYSGR